MCVCVCFTGESVLFYKWICGNLLFLNSSVSRPEQNNLHAFGSVTTRFDLLDNISVSCAWPNTFRRAPWNQRELVVFVGRMGCKANNANFAFLDVVHHINVWCVNNGHQQDWIVCRMLHEVNKVMKPFTEYISLNPTTGCKVHPRTGCEGPEGE